MKILVAEDDLDNARLLESILKKNAHTVEVVGDGEDRKSTRLNSSHKPISYAVFCLKKKKKTRDSHTHEKQI